MTQDPVLTIIWAAIIAFAVAMYVVMDGFDLGIGILFPRFRVGSERDAAMNSIAPVWDGNETWLVLGGGGLMAAFPLAYAVVLPALYAPLIAMLLGLVFRGVAFEFRWRDARHRHFWDMAFCLGSLVATFAQGITLGALLQGIRIEGRAYAGGWWDWLTPFSLLTGLSLVVGYALLGAAWLIWKTEGRVRADARLAAKLLLPMMLVALALVSLATPFLEAQYYARWFRYPGLLVAVPMPLLVAGVGWLLWRALERDAKKWAPVFRSRSRDRKEQRVDCDRESQSTPGRDKDWQPFALTLILFGLALLGLAISIWPDVVPGRLTIWDAAAPARSQIFMLVGTAVLVPVILGYTGWAYWVFRGKVGHEGYH